MSALSNQLPPLGLFLLTMHSQTLSLLCPMGGLQMTSPELLGIVSTCVESSLSVRPSAHAVDFLLWIPTQPLVPVSFSPFLALPCAAIALLSAPLWKHVGPTGFPSPFLLVSMAVPHSEDTPVLYV